MKKILSIAALFVSVQLIGQSNSKLIPYAEEFNYDNNKHLNFVKFKESHQVAQDEVTEFLDMMLFSNPSIKVSLMKEEVDFIGWTNKRYGISVNGIELSNKMIIAHCVNGKMISVNGDLNDITNLTGVFMLSEAAALQKALNKVNATKYKWENKSDEAHTRIVLNQPDFTYFPKGIKTYLEVNGKFIAAYKFNIYAEVPLYRANVFVDASTGAILDEQNLICTTDVPASALTKYSGTQTMTVDQQTASQYRLREVSRGLGVETYNMNNTTTYSATDFTNTSTAWTSTVQFQQVATDAHFGCEVTYDYYWNQHNRNSIDNGGYKLLSYVHYSTNYNNAFWDGQRMTYGDGNGTTFTPLTGLDVCGHEVSHGLTSNTGNLTYSYESGALNEGNSDIFGTCIENFGRPSQWDWKIGKEITPNNLGLRDMQNPSAAAYADPDTYMGTYWYTGTADNGGVHTNSGVYNFWFYLLTAGGTGTNDISNSYTVTGITMASAAKIAFRALTIYYIPSTNFANARLLTIQAAKDLFGACSNEVIQTTNAWYAVGVGAAYAPAAINPNFNSASTNYCTLPANVSFNNTTANGVSYLWNFGDNSAASTATSPAHSYTANGTYTVTLTATGCLSNTASIVQPAYITVNAPALPTATGAAVCQNGSVTLSASGGTLINWYASPTSTTILNTGTSFATPNLTNTTTYYVVNTVTNTPVSGGLTSNTGGGYLANPAHYLTFDVIQNGTLLSAVVWALNSGNRTFELRNSANTILSSTVINLAAGANTVNLNFNLNVGTGYRLGLNASSTADLYRTNTGVSYPYNIGGVVQLTGSSAGPGSYYWSYNIRVQKANCVSPAVPVTATINPAPTISMFADQANLCMGVAPVTISATPVGGTFSGPGMTGNMFNPTITGPGAFTIVYTFTDPTTNCTGMDSLVMTVADCTGLNQIANQMNGVTVYPNPTKDHVIIKNAMLLPGIVVTVCDAAGRVIIEQAIVSNEQSVNTSQLSNGVYLMNIKQGKTTLKTLKLVKE
jgi:Zn-dependent metalloprotease